jgi:undecaprenyl phosphate N,N'-diacetylbacillosamine 1-phosphate transferase
VIDTIISFLGLLVLLPFLAVITLLLLVVNKGNPFFIHERAGQHGKPFKLYKFRTMTGKRDSLGTLLPDKDRITTIGRIIRSTSLDELPQLVNVFLGHMSLIGPRPLPVKYLNRYNQNQARRHLIKPGMTGWAQVNGRNTISWEKKFAYDVYYVENLNFIFDMKILWLTLKKVLVREGINERIDQPMKEFLGN